MISSLLVFVLLLLPLPVDVAEVGTSTLFCLALMLLEAAAYLLLLLILVDNCLLERLSWGRLASSASLSLLVCCSRRLSSPLWLSSLLLLLLPISVDLLMSNSPLLLFSNAVVVVVAVVSFSFYVALSNFLSKILLLEPATWPVGRRRHVGLPPHLSPQLLRVAITVTVGVVVVATTSECFLAAIEANACGRLSMTTPASHSRQSSWFMFSLCIVSPPGTRATRTTPRRSDAPNWRWHCCSFAAAPSVAATSSASWSCCWLRAWRARTWCCPAD